MCCSIALSPSAAPAPAAPAPCPIPTFHHVLPRPGGFKPPPPAAICEILREILIGGLATIMRTALGEGSFKPGDHLKVLYGLWSHHGIYAGSGQVIHLFKDAECIECTTLEFFRDGRCQIWVVPSPARYPGCEIVRRAESKLGQEGYNLFQNNCEHFCNWCRSGRSSSTQVRRWFPA